LKDLKLPDGVCGAGVGAAVVPKGGVDVTAVTEPKLPMPEFGKPTLLMPEDADISRARISGTPPSRDPSPA
jgi:hypothetical protein